MREIHVFENLTLDGVMEAPAAPQEGFPYGGWFGPYADAVTTEPGTDGSQDESGGLLLGRRTYAEMEQGWRDGPPDNPFTAIMNAATKYVVSRSPDAPSDWQHTRLLSGEAAETVAELKQGEGGPLTVLGSGGLVRTLLDAGLADGLTLLITPIVLGTGRRLFESGLTRTDFELVSTRTSGSGVIIASYRASH